MRVNWCEIAWYAYAYAFALGAGQLVGLVTKCMYDIVDPEIKGKYIHAWQALVIGTVERTLFLSSLIAGHGELIGLWVGLKLGMQYKRWTENNSGEKGRTLFMNNLIGNGLSILYAAVGYGIIEWWKTNRIEFALGVPAILIIGTLVTYGLLRPLRKSKGGV